MAECLPFRDSGKGVLIEVLTQPRASKSEVAGMQGNALKVRVAAPPVDGEANEALLRFLAKKLGVAPSAVTLTKGQTCRRKTVCVAGLSEAEARRALGL